MAYTDFEFYTTEYCGDVLTEHDCDKWLSRASDELDALTFGRLTSAFPTQEPHAIRVKKAVCAIADVLCCVDLQRRANTATVSPDGTAHGAVASISSGRESVSYATGATASIYAMAAADFSAQNKLISDTAAKYLAGVPDSTGVNLLYAGC